jgi:hypothetical protein
MNCQQLRAINLAYDFETVGFGLITQIDIYLINQGIVIQKHPPYDREKGGVYAE